MNGECERDCHCDRQEACAALEISRGVLAERVEFQRDVFQDGIGGGFSSGHILSCRSRRCLDLLADIGAAEPFHEFDRRQARYAAPAQMFPRSRQMSFNARQIFSNRDFGSDVPFAAELSFLGIFQWRSL